MPKTLNQERRELLSIAKKLINMPSESPDNTSKSGCQFFIMQWLEDCGFNVHPLPRNGNVDNFVATKGEGKVELGIGLHTDTVPAGKNWRLSDPFVAAEFDGLLFGLGSADMKGGIAALLMALKAMAKSHMRHRKIIIMGSGNEEGVAISPDIALLPYEQQVELLADNYNGAAKIYDYVLASGELPARMMQIESVSEGELWDRYTYGAYGSMKGLLAITAPGGHSAHYRGVNPFVETSRAVVRWDEAPWRTLSGHGGLLTKCTATNGCAGTGGFNVAPSYAWAACDVRIAPGLGIQAVQNFATKYSGVAALKNMKGVKAALNWHLTSVPYVGVKNGKLAGIIQRATQRRFGIVPEPKIAFGGCDNSPFAAVPEKLEFGMMSKWSHMADERIRIADLFDYQLILQDILRILLSVRSRRQVA